ncbi:unnamed protein product [Chrysoparadoxa australica]
MQMLRLTLVLALAAFGMASSSVQPVCGQGQGATCSSGGPLSGVAGTVKERSFYCIKPDGLQRGLVGEIISRFEKKGLQLVGMKLVSPTEELVAEHYSEHKGKVFFDGLVKYFSSGPVIAMVWQGPEVVATGRKLLGKTNPLEADLGTIRLHHFVSLFRCQVKQLNSTLLEASELMLPACLPGLWLPLVVFGCLSLPGQLTLISSPAPDHPQGGLWPLRQ